MESILESALRRFMAQEHIQNVLKGEWVDLFDERRERLKGIRGRRGVAAMTMEGVELGVDLIEMQPGAAFPLHVHPGDHILYVLEGCGVVHVDGVDHRVVSGDTIFVPADYPHGVKTIPDSEAAFVFLAVGHPHKHIDAKDRMHVVAEHSAGHPGVESR